MGKLVTILVGCCVLLFAGSAAGADGAAASAGASARAFAIKVVVPGRGETVSGAVAAPPDAVAFGAGFAYGEGAVASGAITASAQANAGDGSASARASSEVQSLSLFGGEVTVARVTAKAAADASAEGASGDLSGGAVSGLVVAGTPVDTSTPGARVPLGDWGFALVLAQGNAPSEHGFRGFTTALEIHLSADRGGLPAGTTVFVGYAEAAAAATPPPKAPAGPTTGGPGTTEGTTTAGGATSTRAAKRPKPKAGTSKPAKPRRAPVRPIPLVEPKLTPGGYVFPVYGPASYVDTFGAARAVVDWHHGEDVFAPTGAPVLAVADGVLFSVGWNDVGGNRFWLRDANGNEFYYAHLSAFSPLAVNGTRVRAGDVIGFVGNSGDAEATPPHLHFEIHPKALLGLGYDGVINPFRWLNAVERLEDVKLVAGAGWLPPLAEAPNAPRPGAFLLSSTDISSASGLEPGSLTKALRAPVSAEGGEQP